MYPKAETRLRMGGEGGGRGGGIKYLLEEKPLVSLLESGHADHDEPYNRSTAHDVKIIYRRPSCVK